MAEEVKDDWTELNKRKWKPTNKWVVATIIGLGGIAALVINAHGVNDPEALAIVALVTQRAAAYFTGNEPK